MNKKKLLGIVILCIVIVGAYLVFSQNQNKSTPTPLTESKNTSDDSMELMHKTELTDVTTGVVLGVNTQKSAKGHVEVIDSGGNFKLAAAFENLPDPKGTDFYEGWLVSSNPVKAISTGRAEKRNGKYINVFESKEDMSIYTMYVLTLEPDDNDPSSAYHILEGTFK